MKRFVFRRLENLLGLIILVYLIPVVSLSIYSMEFYTPNKSWQILCLGLLLSAAGSLIIFALMRSWEAGRHHHIQPSETTNQVPSITNEPIPESKTPAPDSELIENLQKSLKEHQQKHQLLTNELSSKNGEFEQLQQLSNNLQKQLDEMVGDLSIQKTTAHDQIQQKEVLLGEYQHTITEQRAVIEKKQQHIAQLESKIQDLNYEIKTLVQVSQNEILPLESPLPPFVLNETPTLYQIKTTEPAEEESLPSDKMVRNPDEASILLKRCVDIAQKITGAGYISGNSRYLDMPRNNYALDLRRLFDSLRSENASTVLVYSQKESKLLFVNNQAKNLLGWSPDKFIQNFQDIVQDGLDNWKNGINDLSANPESHARLLMRTKTGQDILVHCQLAVIPTGIFRNHIVGVLYPA